MKINEIKRGGLIPSLRNKENKKNDENENVNITERTNGKPL